MRNNSSTDTYSKITSFFAINITDKNIADLKISFVLTTFLLKIIDCLICSRYPTFLFAFSRLLLRSSGRLLLFLRV